MTRTARSSLLISLLVSGWAISPQAIAQAQVPAQTQVSTPEYKVQPGDTIDVSVWKEDDLKRTAIIRPDGKFSFPLAGEIQASVFSGIVEWFFSKSISGGE